MKRRTVLTRLAAASAAVALPALAQFDRRIVLGQSAAFSGPAGQLGTQLNRGAKLYFDAVNAAGGIHGAQIELRTMDDMYEPDKCKANTEALIKDDVFALFGYVGTPTSLAALPLVNQHKMPFFGPFTGAEALRDPFSRYVFHVRASYFDETAAIVKQLTTMGLKKIAVFRQNDSYGQAGLDGVVRALKAHNLEPVAIGLVERNTVNVSAAVQADRAEEARRHRADQRLQELRRIHSRGAQGRLRRHLLQRVVRRHAGAVRRARARRARRGGEPGDAVSVPAQVADRARVPGRDSEGRRRHQAQLFEHRRLCGRRESSPRA